MDFGIMKIRNDPNRQYVVVIRAGSRLRISQGEELKIETKIKEAPCVLTFRTRYLDEGFESRIPRDMWIDARGPFNNLNSAITEFTNAASFYTTVISFCSNGFGGECNFHLAFDNSKCRRKREFFQQFLADECGLPGLTRRINLGYVKESIDSLGKSEHGERLRRAITQYVLALERWKRGNEILSTAHLYMGIEALVPVIKKIELDKACLSSNKELADLWKIDIRELDPTIKRDHLFQGDLSCYRDAKKASDGIEHGFLSYAELRPLSEHARDKSAFYLREAIVKLLELPPNVKVGLLSPPYATPIGTIDYIRYLRGTLSSRSSLLAAERQEYPLIDWVFKVSGFRFTDEGKLNLSFSESLTPRVADGVTFTPRSIEIYGPEGVISESAACRTKIEAQITPALPKPDDEFISAIRSFAEVKNLITNYPSSELHTANIVDAEILRLLSNCRSHFLCILLLIEKQFGEQALLISRYLIQDATRLIHLAGQH